MDLIYSENIKLTANDYLCDQQIKPSSVLNLFQTVASDHAELIGMGFKEMLAKDIIWVIVKTRYDVVAPVPFACTVKVVTVPQPKGRVGYVRDYFVYDLNDNLLIKGSTLWCLASVSTRKFVRPTIDYVGTHVSMKAYDDDFARLSPVCSQNNGYVCPILRTHLDRNGHANNIHYADFAINCINYLPSISSFAIQFSCESKEGDVLNLYHKYDNESIIVSGKNGERDAFMIKFN